MCPRVDDRFVPEVPVRHFDHEASPSGTRYRSRRPSQEHSSSYNRLSSAFSCILCSLKLQKTLFVATVFVRFCLRCVPAVMSDIILKQLQHAMSELYSSCAFSPSIASLARALVVSSVCSFARQEESSMDWWTADVCTSTTAPSQATSTSRS